MRYISTRGQVSPVSFQEAVLMGLAEDGGLLIPEGIPDLSGILEKWRSLSYMDLAFEIFRHFATDIPDRDLRGLVAKSYASSFSPKVAPTVKVGDLHILELFHGPTLAFKDVALQLLGNLFEYILERTGGSLNILGATSGDTGSAAIYGVRGREHINIFIMHPYRRVSPIQERQMTAVLDANVHNIAIEGSFDDCQAIMKTLARDLDFKLRYSLGAVNSVNWGRVLAQIVYYFATVFDVQKSTGADSVQVCVPTGNFGNILAGWYARQMGLPISRLILATNENDILSRFFNTGVYSMGEVVHTLSPAMDIQISSNFERYLYYHVGRDAGQLRSLMEQFGATGSLNVKMDSTGRVDPVFAADRCTIGEMLSGIRKYFEKHQYILDPHTAVGVTVAERFRTNGVPLICLATAHPAKFPDAIQQATGKDVARHPDIDALRDLPTRCKVLPNDKEAVRKYIVETIGR